MKTSSQRFGACAVALAALLSAAGLSACNCSERTGLANAIWATDVSQLDFGTVPAGTRVTRNVRLLNQGPVSITVSALRRVTRRVSPPIVNAKGSGRPVAEDRKLTAR